MTPIRTPVTVEMLQTDRSAYIRYLAETSDGAQTVEEVTAQLDAQDQSKLQAAESLERFYSGKAFSAAGNTSEAAATALTQAREARSRTYSMLPGAVTIEALNIDWAVKAQGTIKGSDLKDISTYAEYLRSELAAATSVRSDVTFTGTWGKGQVTHDINEYIGWLMQAAQGKSAGAAKTA